MLRWLALASALLSAAAAMASPPPPPPEYVGEAATVLMDVNNRDQSRIAPYFADDVAMSINGRVSATGKAPWLAWWVKDRRHYYAYSVGHSEGYNEDGTLLVVEVYETSDRSTSPPPPGDGRPSTRSTFYQFGADHLIHRVAIARQATGDLPPDQPSISSARTI